ncbi:MAG: hypothetical protein V1858_03795 [Candidatus Gottesmanbacteria bacterium]
MIEDRYDRSVVKLSLSTINDVKTHFWHYLILLMIIAIGGIAFIKQTNIQNRFYIGSLVAIAYVFWGIFHHLMEKNLKLKIVIEYSLIALMAVVLLGGILL